MSLRGQEQLLHSFQNAYDTSLTSLSAVIRLIESKLIAIAQEQNTWKMKKAYVRNNDGFLGKHEVDEPSRSSLVRAIGKLFQTIVRPPTSAGPLLDVAIALHVLQHLGTGEIPPVVDACKIALPDSRSIGVPVLVVTVCESDDAQALLLLKRKIRTLTVLIQAAPEKVDNVILPKEVPNASVYVYREPKCENQTEVNKCNN